MISSTSEIDIDSIRQIAASAAFAAVEADTSGDCVTAAYRYDEAANHLAIVLDAEAAEGIDRKILQGKITEYRARAEKLRNKKLASSLPSPPRNDGDEAEASEGGARENASGRACEDSSSPAAVSEGQGAGSKAAEESRVITVALETFRTAAAAATTAAIAAESLREIDQKYQVTHTIGSTAIACAEKVKEIDRDYQVQDRVAQAAVSTYHTVRSIEEEYKVSERVVDGVKSAAKSAVQAEEEYRLTERMNAAVNDSIQYAAMMDERYAIRQRAAEALQEAWETTKNLGVMAAEYDQEYRISARAGQAIQDSFYYAVESAKEAASSWSISSTVQRTAVPPNADV